MPQDQRRINGPETTVAYRYHSKINLKTYEEKLADAFHKQTGRRSDGRQLLEARKIFIKSDLISQAKGSAYIELGATKVIVAVYDPREIPKQNKYSINGELYCDFKFSPFACIKRRLPQTDAQEKSLALSMKRALESAVCRHEFPNFQVDIYANVLQDDGSALSAAITCAGLALADAGIPMYDVITACTVGIVQDKFLLDPTAAEEDLCNNGVTSGDEHGVIVMARLATHDQISELRQAGLLSFERVQAANDILLATNKEIVPVINQILVRKVMKKVESKATEEDTKESPNKEDDASVE